MRRALTVGLIAAASCGGNEAPHSVPVRDVTVTAASASILVGAKTQLSAQVVGTDGNLVEGAQVQWSSASPTVVSVSPDGMATGLLAGQGTVRASSGGRSGEFVLLVRNPPVATLAFDRDSATLLLPGGALTLVPVAKDAGGRAIPNPTLFYSIDAPRVATVSPVGVVTAIAAGTAIVSGSADGVTATLRIRVTVSATSTSPKITAVTPLVAGASAVISGSNFAPSIGGNAVLVEGIPVTVTAATTTQLNVTLPSSGWACAAERPVALQVNANNETGVATASLRVAIRRTLAVGQSLVVSTGSESRCNELAGTGGSYLVTVYNPARSMAGTNATFTLRGAAVGAVAGVVASATGTGVTSAAARGLNLKPELSAAAPSYPAIGTAGFARRQEDDDARRSEVAHRSLMERSLAFARTQRSAAVRRRRAATEGAAPVAGPLGRQVTQLGSVTPLKIPNLDAPGLCTASIPIGARTAWIGQHAVIVEDTATLVNGQATLKGQLDAYYEAIGQEFDTVMWPILTENFGNPLAYDQKLSGTGKIVMLFSPRINAMVGGALAGFVVSCDFHSTFEAPSSNVGEYFYAIMPTSLASGLGAGTRDAWLRSMRSTIIHEAKHITAFGERFARDGGFEELWLEEGLARHAEEQYARRLYGVSWKNNTGYQASVSCEFPLLLPAECAGRPLLMSRHFDALYEYLQGPDLRSVLGSVSPGDATYYATSWSVVRWMIDQYATSEATFLSQLVQTTQLGITNLEARAGHAWEEMFGYWVLALFADDYPGVSFADSRLGFPSWNQRDVFRNMCVARGPCQNAGNPSTLYPLAFPLVPRPLAFGTFTENVAFLNAATFTAWYLSGAQAAPQLIELRGAAGGDPPPQLRLAIVRLQ